MQLDICNWLESLKWEMGTAQDELLKLSLAIAAVSSD